MSIVTECSRSSGVKHDAACSFKRRRNSAIRSGRIVSPDTVSSMLTPHGSEEESPEAYGYGMELVVEDDLGDQIPKIEDGPWPAFPADLTSIALAPDATTVRAGRVLFSLGRRLGLGDLVDDRPHLLLGRLDHRPHAARAVDAEDDVDAGFVLSRLDGRGGRRQRQHHRRGWR